MGIRGARGETKTIAILSLLSMVRSVLLRRLGFMLTLEKLLLDQFASITIRLPRQSFSVLKKAYYEC